MAKIPEDVNEWSKGVLIDLLDEGYDENLRLEFKSKIDSMTKRIPITGCAFANTMGGFLVFGIDNDRKKKWTTDQRLVGLEDSDQLKSQINNQIRNIEPSIPIENIEFKESNITLTDGKVIVILKISKTTIGPHQFKEIFYKRVANGNAPMDVNEIKNAIIEAQKSSRMLYLLEQEEDLLMDILNSMILLIDDNEFTSALNYIKHLNYQSFTHFLYNYSSFYNTKIQDLSYKIVYELHRLETNEKVARSRITRNEVLGDSMDIFKKNLLNCSSSINEINQLLDISYADREDGFLEKIKISIKTKMAEVIKEKKSSEEKIESTTSKQV